MNNIYEILNSVLSGSSSGFTINNDYEFINCVYDENLNAIRIYIQNLNSIIDERLKNYLIENKPEPEPEPKPEPKPKPTSNCGQDLNKNRKKDEVHIIGYIVLKNRKIRIKRETFYFSNNRYFQSFWAEQTPLYYDYFNENFLRRNFKNYLSLEKFPKALTLDEFYNKYRDKK